MKEYQYKGTHYCGFCDKDAIFHRETCLITPKCRVDFHWCTESACQKAMDDFFEIHNEECHASVDLV